MFNVFVYILGKLYSHLFISPSLMSIIGKIYIHIIHSNLTVDARQLDNVMLHLFKHTDD